MANPLLPDVVLGNTTHTGHGRWVMLNPKKEPIFRDFDALIEQAVCYQQALLYVDLNEDMQLALGVAALRENKECVLDAEFDNFNALVADILESKGSAKNLRQFYDQLVSIFIAGRKQSDAHVAYCINNALEKEEDKQAFHDKYFQYEWEVNDA